jgi:putative protease
MQEREPTHEQQVGVVTHYWNHVKVAGVHLTGPIDVGDHIHIVGHTSDFEQDVGSIEVDHQRVRHADAGDDVGIHVVEHAREHDAVYKDVIDDVGEGQQDL